MDICRLCGQKNSVNDLCNINDAELMIEIKLEKVFKIRLANEKLLPNSVCFDCIIKLENSLGFLDLLEQTQAILMSNLKTQLNQCDSPLLEKDIKMEEIFATEMEDLIPTSSRVPAFAEKKSIKKKAPVRKVQKKSEQKRSSSNLVIRVEDIFKKELTQNVYETNPDTLDVSEESKNSDGTLSESGQLRMLEMGCYTWKCNECYNVLESSQSLENHFKAVHVDKKITYSCCDCPSSFKSFFTFQNHMIDSHRPHMKFFCDICSEYRWNLVDLFKHRQESHPKYKNTCLYCGKVFECGFHLKQHSYIHMKLDERQMFQCDLCSFTAHSKYNIRQHLIINHFKPEEEHICELCGKICKRLSDMRSHQLVHTSDRPFACDLCELSFKCVKQLRCHKKLHFPRLYSEECKVCGKKFTTKGKLSRHFMIHTDEYAFTCEFCGRKFKHSSGFMTHRRIHTGERPYECSTCFQKFIDWPNMNKHMKNKHSIDNSSRKNRVFT